MNKITKKFINQVDTAVDDSLKGFSLLFPGLCLNSEYRFFTIANENISSHVAILSGGGSGHEPFCTGYVGEGMLAGSVAGSVFTSPPKMNILQGIRHLSHYYKGGIVVIIPNYTGDCLNFGMAVEQAKQENINVETVVIGEDCASGSNSITGRRGMCGLLFTYKIGGGLAANGEKLPVVIKELYKVQNNIYTIGISLASCSLPGQGPLFSIADDEMELGTGVHGEAGIQKLKLGTANQAIKLILMKLFESIDFTITSVAVLINNLGATSQLEQNIICAEVHSQLTDAGITVERMYAGMFMTSIDMVGFQVSLFNLPEESKYSWLKLLDRDTKAPCWTGNSFTIPSTEKKQKISSSNPVFNLRSQYILSNEEQTLFKVCLEIAAAAIIKNEAKLNELDSGCGDGDCGTTLKHLADGILRELSHMTLECPANVLRTLSVIAETKMGGTSGAIYSLCFTAMAKVFMESSNCGMHHIWAHAWIFGVDTIMKYGRARLGDRTIIDALRPAAENFKDGIAKNKKPFINIIEESVQVAKEGCNSTKNMKARAGRASYVNGDRLIDVDAGAYGFLIWFQAIAECLMQ